MRRWWGFLLLFGACSEDQPAAPDAQADASIPDATKPDTGVDAGIDTGADVYVDAGIDVDGGCDASFMDDPRNCGRCAHDCVGGACEAGVCLPWTVVDTPASDVVADDTNVYWVYAGGSGQGSAGKCPRGGCDAGVPLVSNATSAIKIAHDSTRIYYTTYSEDAGVLATCAKAGCDGGATILSGPQKYPAWLLIDSTSVYWNVGNFELWTCTLPGCADGGGALTTMTVDQGLAQDATNVFWSESYTDIVTCQKSACGTTRKTIATGLSVLNLAAYGTKVYAIGNDRIVSCPSGATSCSPTTVVQNVTGAADLEVDATGVYLISYGTTATSTSALSYCPLSGCSSTPTPLISNLNIVTGIALDKDAVYVSTDGTGIRGIAKP